MNVNESNIKQLASKDISTNDIYYSIIESLLFVTGESLKLTELANILECSIEFTRDRKSVV